MSGITFTLNQQEAIDRLDRNVSISAGAGSGKTEVLVQRFCRIVEEGRAGVDEILTVTFTEKAAKEMKERIVRRFAENFQKTGEKRYEEARRGVESAYIGTIHSFASRLLRENSFEAGIAPQFAVLTEPEAATLKDRVLEELMAREHEKGTAEYKELAFAFGKDCVLQAVKKLHSHTASLGRDISQIQIAAPPQASPQELVQTYCDFVGGLFAELHAGRLTPSMAERVREFEALYPGLNKYMFESLAWTRLDNPLAYMEAFDWDVFSELSLAKEFIKGPMANDVKARFVEPAREVAKQFLDALLSPMLGYYVECLKRVTGDFTASYREAKRQAGALDFDDLLLLAKSLLLDSKGNKTRTALEYADKFKYVVMDEFQDTNQLQKSMIQAVCPKGRFFTVGDVKQSIFAFIHSDVDIFIEHHDRIKKGEGLPLSFVENFRSRPGIIKFVNWLFKEIWAEDADFEFEELSAKGEFHPKEDPDVQIMLVPNSAGADAARLDEARTIAARVNELLGRTGKPPLQVTKIKKPGDQPRDLRPGDILVLFRATKSIPLYERVLADAGIECYVVSGRGFYGSHEVQDILNLLRVVDNPLNDVAMAAVLRSPLVNITDDALFLLTRKHNQVEDEEQEADESDIPARNREIGKLYASMRSVENIRNVSDEDKERMVLFRNLLDDLHRMRSDSRITRLMDEALARTQYDLKVLASANGKRKFANIRKLLDVAQGFETSRLCSLPDFIRYVENLAVVAEREGEAATETEDSPVVRLMTVHAAKGLQAPVVIVADCAREKKPHRGKPGVDSDAFVACKNHGIGCRIRNPITDEKVETEPYVYIRNYIKDKDAREEKRLLYVAATRAEEHLILSGSSKFNGRFCGRTLYRDINCWSGWLEKAFQIESAPEGGEGMLFAGEVPVRFYTLAVGEAAEICRPKTLLESRWEYLLSGGMDETEETGRAIVDRCFTEISDADSRRTLTVSQVLSFLRCPKQYYYRWILGIADAGFDLEEDRKEQEGVSPATLGTAVHDVLAAVDFSGDFKSQIELLTENQDPTLRPTVQDRCLKLLESPWFTRITSAQELLQESPFVAAFDGINLLGRIDLLFRDENGWVAADYKTGSGFWGDRYQDQLGLYALTVERCLGVRPRETVVIVLGDGEDRSSVVDDVMLREAESDLRQTVEMLRLKQFVPSRQPSCKYCPYSNLCG